MAHTGAVVPSLSSLTSLLSKVSRQYEGALKSSAIFFYPSKITVLSQEIIPGTSRAVSVPWTIRCVPALLDKAKERTRKENDDQSRSGKADNVQGSIGDATTKQQNPHDVFAPPYHPDLLVEELPQHTILLNKFCVVPKHFLLVTRVFQPQNLPPAPEMLAIGYRILTVHKRLAQQGSPDAAEDKELLAFYNCGEVSGASQPHQHMQFAELGSESDETAKGPDGGAIPIERLLSRIPQDGKEDDIFALPLPHQHFVSLIRQPPIDDDVKLTEYLGAKLLSLLDALFQARIVAASAGADNRESSVKKSPPSYNLLMTTRAMHLVPRQQEEFHGLRELVQQDRTTHVEDGVELVGSVSINSLGYAGHLLVKSEKELEYLRRYPGGIAEVLKSTGVPPVADITTDSHHEL